MSPAEELQRVVFAALTANATLMGLVDGIYDRVPTPGFAARQAYISFGPHQVVADDADCITGGEHTLQIDVWSRAVGAMSAKAICGRVKTLLHEQDLPFSEHALAELLVASSQTFADPDGVTTHGVVLVEAAIEEAV
jgi:hypothetical protein